MESKESYRKVDAVDINNTDVKNAPPTISEIVDKKIISKDVETQRPKPSEHDVGVDHPTSFFETLTHLLRGNIGSGLFAMGDACRNAGIILYPILTLGLAIICVHSQHLLLTSARKMKNKLGYDLSPDFAETVELSFANGPPRLRKFSSSMKLFVNSFLCVTQLGFCCVYLVFITSNVKQILDIYGFNLDLHLIMFIVYILVLLPSMITNLKYLAPCSSFANICMITAIGITFYYASQDLPSISERSYVASLQQLPLFFGTAIYSFEGIGLVLPLKNVMKKPNKFGRPAGVLNIGMSIVTALLISFGFLGYLKYGDDVAGSLTLNIPQDKILAQSVKAIVSLGILFTYPLQFYVPVQILWPAIIKARQPFKNPVFAEICFRVAMVTLTFAIAGLVPQLNVFISLIGALCSTALALVFPPLLDLINSWEYSLGANLWRLFKNFGILFVALIGFSTGTYESVSAIIKTFF